MGAEAAIGMRNGGRGTGRSRVKLRETSSSYARASSVCGERELEV